MNKSLHVYEIDDGEQHWYVATSEAAALRAYIKNSWGSFAEYRKQVAKEERATVTQCYDTKRKTINFENDHGDYDDPVTKLCRTWAKEFGPGFLATTCI